MLHITNGDSAGGTLRTFLDNVAITCDPLHDGPALPLEGVEWARMRARHLGVEETRSALEQWDSAFVDAPRHDEVVLWFEHDLFDQLLIIRTLDLLVRLKADPTPTGVASGFSRTLVSMICIDRFPGVDPFYGLGQLEADQLESLLPTRKPVTAAQYAIASRTWKAFREPEPAALVEQAATPGALDALPFLRDALIRFFQEFPSTLNGLSRTEQSALDALAEEPMTLRALFRATQLREERPFMGDLGFFDGVRALASARLPLVMLDGETAAITDAGREIRAGRADAVSDNGIDRWRGGHHLTNSTAWRWDAGRQTLVSLQPR